MTPERRAGRRGATWGGLVLLGAIGGCLAFGSSAAVAAEAGDPASGGSNISVNVTDGSTPTPDPTTGGTDGGSSSSGGSGTTGVSSTDSGGATSGGGEGSPATPAAPAGEVSVAGMLYVGGLQTGAATSPNPADGVVTLWVTVRNASTSPFDASARFWMNSSVFRNDLDVEEQIAIPALQPGETRVVSAQLHHGGQWTLIDAHVTITPPDSVDGTALTPVTREATVFLFPWLISLVLVVGAVGFVLVRVARGVVVDPIPADAT